MLNVGISDNFGSVTAKLGSEKYFVSNPGSTYVTYGKGQLEMSKAYESPFVENHSSLEVVAPACLKVELSTKTELGDIRAIDPTSKVTR